MTKFLVSYLHKNGFGSCFVEDKRDVKITEKLITETQDTIRKKTKHKGVGIINIIKLEEEE